jgi:hypothetical protein
VTALVKEGNNQALSHGEVETGWEKESSKTNVPGIAAVGSPPADILHGQAQRFSVMISATPALQQTILQEI